MSFKGETMFKEESIKTLQVLTILIAISVLIASTAGIIFPDIYKYVVEDSAMPFVIAQDVVTLIAAISLLAIAFFGKRKNIKLDILQIGIIGYVFYAYGPHVMGTLYNYFYFLYLCAFGLSIFYFISAFANIEYKRLAFDIPNPLRLIIAVYCAVMPVLFAPQWIVGILQAIQAHARPTDFGMYWVYILDLCFVLPVCALTSVFLFQKKPLGYLLGGILSIKGFTLMLSVALGNYFQPLFHQEMVVGGAGGAVLFSTVALVFLVLSIFYFMHAKIIKRMPGPYTDREFSELSSGSY
jgi:hypothetical protein